MLPVEFANDQTNQYSTTTIELDLGKNRVKPFWMLCRAYALVDFCRLLHFEVSSVTDST